MLPNPSLSLIEGQGSPQTVWQQNPTLCFSHPAPWIMALFEVLFYWDPFASLPMLIKPSNNQNRRLAVRRFKNRWIMYLCSSSVPNLFYSLCLELLLDMCSKSCWNLPTWATSKQSPVAGAMTWEWALAGDTTATSFQPWGKLCLTYSLVNKRNHPQMAELFRLVKYYNLPRFIHNLGTLWYMVLFWWQPAANPASHNRIETFSELWLRSGYWQGRIITKHDYKQQEASAWLSPFLVSMFHHSKHGQFREVKKGRGVGEWCGKSCQWLE